MFFRRVLAFLVVFALILYLILSREISVTFHGSTMGTQYQLTCLIPIWARFVNVEGQIRERLKELNAVFSTYAEDSEISRFNRLQSTRPVLVSETLYTVLLSAKKIVELTDGAFDPTIKPLVDNWGFSEFALHRVPSEEERLRLLDRTGFHKLEFLSENRLRKHVPWLMIDLSSIAKGYAVDELGRVLERYQIRSYLIEIGGEVFARGKKNNGRLWQIGITTPDFEVANQSLFSIVRLNNQGLATSGDYRNYFKRKNQTYSHIIDPRSGRPIQNNVASVSVIAPTCMLADGLATGLLVMGPEKGLALVESLNDVEGLFILRQSQTWASLTSSHFFSDFLQK